MEGLTQLAEYGVVGICLALIGALVYFVKMMTNLMSNHMKHNTSAMTELSTAIAELKAWLEAKNGS